MQGRLRCWNCDRDLPQPPFARWTARRQPDTSSTVACERCGWRYEVTWNRGWRIVAAHRPVSSSQ
jgi:RNase P subunit RPR2